MSKIAKSMEGPGLFSPDSGSPEVAACVDWLQSTYGIVVDRSFFSKDAHWFSSQWVTMDSLQKLHRIREIADSHPGSFGDNNNVLLANAIKEAQQEIFPPRAEHVGSTEESVIRDAKKAASGDSPIED